MKALIYLTGRSFVNNLKKAVKKPVTLLLLIFFLAYAVVVCLFLGQIAVEEWESSQDHRSGMLDKTRSSIGVGVAKGISPVNGEPCWYCVQWFLRDGYEITWVDEPLIQR